MSIIKIKPYIIDTTQTFAFNAVTVTGNLTAGNLTTSGSSGNISGANNITANFFIGNGASLSAIAGANVTGQVNYATTANSVAVANVTGIGNIATINKDGNASNILYGNGVFASAPVTYGNSNVATFLANFGSNTISTTGNITAGNLTTGGTGGNISGANNVTANFFIGNGASLSAIAGANVTGYVANATHSNVADAANSVAVANVTGIGNIATINKDGNASNILYGNGSFAAAPVTYGNSNVATYLASFGSNTISTTGNITAGNLVVGGNLTVNGTLTSINSTIVQIDDLAIVLANDASNSTQANGAGIIINGASANMLYVSTSNAFVFSHKISADGGLLSNITGANVTGAVSYATTANSVAGANVSGQVTYAATANAVAVANVTGIGNIATVNKDGNASNILYGNGVFASAPVTYGNSNVATFLASFGSNSISTTGNITAGNISTGGSGGNITGANNITATGDVSAGNVKTDNLLYANGTPYAFTSNASGSNTQVQFNDGNSFAGSSSLTFDKTTNTLTANNFTSIGNVNLGAAGNVHITGGTTGQYLKTDGAGNLSWATVSGGSGSGITYTANTAPPVSANVADQWYNTTTNTLYEYMSDGTTSFWVDIQSPTVSVSNAGNNTAGFVVRNYTGSGSQTNFTITAGLNESSVLVIQDGVIQAPTSDYTVSGTTLTFTTAPGSGSKIQIRELAYAIPTTSTLGVSTNLSFTGNVSVAANTTTNNLSVTGMTTLGNVGNVKITGGSSGQAIVTDGAGNLSFGSAGMSAAKVVGYNLVFGG